MQASSMPKDGRNHPAHLEGYYPSTHHSPGKGWTHFQNCGEDLTELVNKHIPLFKAILEVNAYPKNVDVWKGVETWLRNLGAHYADRESSYFKQQCYQVTQLIHHAQKMSNNIKTGERKHPALFDLLNLLQKKQKKKLKLSARKLLRRTSSSPQTKMTSISVASPKTCSPSAHAAPCLTGERMQEIFGFNPMASTDLDVVSVASSEAYPDSVVAVEPPLKKHMVARRLAEPPHLQVLALHVTCQCPIGTTQSSNT
eukprot:1720107-Amphidinium_carterae.2